MASEVVPGAVFERHLYFSPIVQTIGLTTNMLHELLAMLAGFADLESDSGDIFIPDPPPPSSATTLIIRPDFPYLHSSERASINRISHIAFLFTRISSLMTTITPEFAEAASKDSVSIYYMAFVGAVDSYLEDYKARIVLAERKALTPNDPDTSGGRIPLSYLMQSFGKYERILPHLLSLFDSISSDPSKHHGLRLLSEIYTRLVHSGSSEVREMWTFLLGRLNQVMAKQIGTWCSFGILADPGKEFFVAGPPELDPWLAVDDFGPGDVGKGEKSVEGGKDGLDESMKWSWEFTLDKSLIPCFMTEETVKDILFIGQTMHSISKSEKFSFDITDKMSRRNLLLMEPLTDITQFNTLALEMVFKKIRKSVAQSLWNIVVVGEKLELYLEACRNYFLLGRGDFFLRLIEETETLRTERLARLTKLTEFDVNLISRESAERTSAASDAIFEQFHFSKIAVDPSDLYSFTMVLGGLPVRLELQAKWPITMVLNDDNLKTYNRLFSFLINLKSCQLKLQRIWTLTSTSARSTTATRATDAQGTSQRPRQRQNRTAAGGGHGQILPRDVWRCRLDMLFFVDCLWSYVQLDVIAAQYHRMLERASLGSHQPSKNDSAVNNPSVEEHSQPQSAETSNMDDDADFDVHTRDFEQVITAHTDMLDACLKGCFLEAPDAASDSAKTEPEKTVDVVGGLVGDGLSAPPQQRVKGLRVVEKTLRDILNGCGKFCGSVERMVAVMQREENGEGLAKRVMVFDGSKAVGGKLEGEFTNNVAFLFRSLKSIREAPRRSLPPILIEHLDALLLRLDHNAFYSKNAGIVSTGAVHVDARLMRAAETAAR
ncbi:Spc98 family-domain-containing protein [Chytridium lagenaria]|nr:Spc98 family-domain-containing protein [Chytridium lagenaria]